MREILAQLLLLARSYRSFLIRASQCLMQRISISVMQCCNVSCHKLVTTLLFLKRYKKVFFFVTQLAKLSTCGYLECIYSHIVAIVTHQLYSRTTAYLFHIYIQEKIGLIVLNKSFSLVKFMQKKVFVNQIIFVNLGVRTFSE